MSMKVSGLAAPLVASVALLAATAAAQQTVPFAGGIPVAPHGLATRPLPDKPVEFDTAEGQKIRVVVVTKALEYPWSLAFLPDGSMLVTERAGRLRIIRNGVLDPQPIAGGPPSYWAIESGLPGAVHGYMEVVLHPRFAENHYVYLTYTKPLDEKRRTVAIARGRFDGHALTEARLLAYLALAWKGDAVVSCSASQPQQYQLSGRRQLQVPNPGSYLVAHGRRAPIVRVDGEHVF